MNVSKFPMYHHRFTDRANQGPEETAFHLRLLEDPDDDTTRLVYADWCEEHGKDEKAQWLRAEGPGSALQWFLLARALNEMLEEIELKTPSTPPQGVIDVLGRRLK